MRTLVLLTDGFGGHGGIAKFNRDLLRSLCSHPACTETIAIPRLIPNPPGVPAPGSLPIRLRHETGGVGSKWRYLGAVLRAMVRERDVDLVICGHINLLPLAYFSARRLRAPLLLIVHGVEAWQATGRRWTDRLAGRVDGFLSVSEFTREKFLRWASRAAVAAGGTPLPGLRSWVVPDCVELKDFLPAAGTGPKPPVLLKRYGLQGRKVLMTVARLSASERYKGIDEVLEVMPDLAVTVPSLAYLIAGDGTDRSRLEQKAITLGLKDRVVFAGRVSEEEKADHYRVADAFVMPGFGEGFGIVYLEAMACGIPVVASKLDASREAVKNGELGIVVDPRDREDLKAGILQALQRPCDVVPEGLDFFSYENFRRRLHQVLNELLRPK